MFDRFTESAKKVLNLGRQEAQQLQHDFFGPEHILLGLVAEEHGAAARFLSACGFRLDGLRADVAAAFPPGISNLAQLPFSVHAKRILELTMEEAEGLSHGVLGSVHLLLGILREGESLAARLLDQKGIDLANARALAQLDGGTDSEKYALPAGAERAALERPWPLTQDAERVLALGLREAAGLGHSLGPEYLLLGLLADGESPSALFLKELGLTLESYRAFLTEE